MVLTYDSLKQIVLAYLNRSDDATKEQIPTFIGLAEDQIKSDSNVIGLVPYFSGVFNQGNPIYPLPANWVRPITLSIIIPSLVTQKRKPIPLRTYDYLTQYSPDRTAQQEPQYYALYGDANFLIAPTPDMNYPFEMAYYQEVPPLSEQNQSNWFTIYTKNLLVFGTLYQAGIYLKDQELIDKYSMAYAKAVQLVNQDDLRRKVDRQTDIEAD